MYVEAILALMRLTESSEEVVANLAKMVLGLVEQMREFEVRAGLAEAALEAREAKLAAVEAMILHLTVAGDANSPQTILHKLAETIG